MKRIVAQNTESATENANNFARVDFRHGDAVLARTVKGEWVERRVWSDAADVVYLCSDRLFDELSRGCSILWPIGFPKADVKPMARAT